MTAAEMLAVLQPCLHGSITTAARALILSGDVNQFPHVREFADRVVQAHSDPPPFQKDQRMGELLYHLQEAKKFKANGYGYGCDLALVAEQLREEFFDLKDHEFTLIFSGKAPGRYYRIASQIRFRQTLSEAVSTTPTPI